MSRLKNQVTTMLNKNHKKATSCHFQSDLEIALDDLEAFIEWMFEGHLFFNAVRFPAKESYKERRVAHGHGARGLEQNALPLELGHLVVWFVVGEPVLRVGTAHAARDAA